MGRIAWAVSDYRAYSDAASEQTGGAVPCGQKVLFTQTSESSVHLYAGNACLGVLPCKESFRGGIDPDPYVAFHAIGADGWYPLSFGT